MPSSSIKSHSGPAVLSLVAGTLLTIYLLAHLLSFLFGEDQATFAVIGDGLLRGEVPYRDLLDTKPPIIFAIYAFASATLGSNQASIRVIESAALLSLLPAFAILSKRFIGWYAAGWIAFVLAILFHVQLGFWHTGQAESFAGFILVWALVALTGASTRSAWFPAASGVLFAFAGLLKFPLGGGAVPCFLVEAYRRWTQTKRLASGLSVIAIGLAAALLIVAAVVSAFVWADATADLQWVFGSVVPHYPSIRSPEPFGSLLVKALSQPFTRAAPIAIPSILLLIYLPKRSPREREGFLHILAIVLPQSLGVALQGKFFLYHSAGVLPFLALLSSWGIWKMMWIVRARPGTTLCLAVVLACLQAVPAQRFWRVSELRVRSWLEPERRTSLENRLYSSTNSNRVSIRRVVTWLKEHTDEDSNILVWSFNPTIYYLADRRPASRFVGNHPLRFDWSQRSAERLMMSDLEGQSVSAVIVAHGDRTPWVTGNQRDSAAELERLPHLQQYLLRNFTFGTRIGPFEILVPADAESRVYLFEDSFESGTTDAWSQTRSPGG